MTCGRCAARPKPTCASPNCVAPSQRGATLVASSRSASHEVISVLGVARSRVVVVPPAVPLVDATHDGTDLVVNITGVDELFIELAPQLIAFTRSTRFSRRRAREHGRRAEDPLERSRRDDSRPATTRATPSRTPAS